MKEIFRFPLSLTDTITLLTAAYRAEVEYRHLTFIDTPQTKAAISAAAQFLATITPKFGVIFLGMSGNGKTTLLNALQQAVRYLSHIGILPEDTGIRIADAKRIATAAKSSSHFQAYADTPLLAIEDVGREPAELLDYGNVLSPIADIIEYRYDAQLFTLLTTNLNPREIRERYGERIADRLNEMCDKIVFTHSSYRTFKPNK